MRGRCDWWSVVCVAELAYFFFLIFFFQGEDCLRFGRVAGVPSCALPFLFFLFFFLSCVFLFLVFFSGLVALVFLCSEERRVGKECKFRGSPYH